MPAVGTVLLSSAGPALAAPKAPLHHLYVKVGPSTHSVWIQTEIPVVGGGPNFSACRQVDPGGGYQDAHQDLYSNASTTVIGFSSGDCTSGYERRVNFVTQSNAEDIQIDLT
jgi:hypothetical protein